MDPERVSNDGQQGNDYTAPLPPRLAPGPHFIPQFARRRPLRAVLLAAAVFAIPYSLARHQADVNSPRIEAYAPRVARAAPPTVSAPAAPSRLSAALPMNSGMSNV